MLNAQQVYTINQGINIKSIHRGFLIGGTLDTVSINQRPFALAIGEHPQTLNLIINGIGSNTIHLALKI